MANVIKAILELIDLEKRAEKLGKDIIDEIKKEKNARKRKKLLKAYKKRDRAAVSALWFDRH